MPADVATATAPDATLPPPPPPVLPSALRGPDHETEAATRRLVVWAMEEDHRPARLVAARSAAERILSLEHTPSPRRVAGRLTEEQTRELLLHALRGLCRRPGLLAHARRVMRGARRAVARLLGRKTAPAATLNPITIELE
jgi:hypothetical protein